ncbi:hypothetical protein EMIT0194P_70119 [Pseudomonas serbica]
MAGRQQRAGCGGRGAFPQGLGRSSSVGGFVGLLKAGLSWWRIYIRLPLTPTERTIPYTAAQVTRLSRIIVSSIKSSLSRSHSSFGRGLIHMGATEFHHGPWTLNADV